ncbi:DgyrCDS6283 [Dimorphilus gyrociliatus]|uniref:DgyrCDS6283 n=1 Tax=Dimorphilus gyrociliatus TaxID=2664684 RepID=A0A7I8VMK9_9ANNE|nr:DgyrCDS6283 [Dimorphilus gyrociliatus]
MEIESQIIEEFRKVLQASAVDDRQFTDRELEKFIIARNSDLEKAKDQILGYFAFQETWNTRDILQWDVPPVLRKFCPGGYSGWARSGHPVWIDIPGKIDIKGLTMSAKKSDFVRYQIYKVEELLADMRSRNSPDQVIMIHDLSGYSLKLLFTPGMDILIKVLVLLEDNYPETLFKCYVVNAPRIFPIIYEIVKPFLSKRTSGKVKILGNNYKEELVAELGPDCLPESYGGNLSGPDGDPEYSLKVCQGGTVPPEFFADDLGYDLSEFTEAKISPGKSVDETIKVEKPFSILSWAFQTKSKDIQYGLFFRPLEEANSQEQTIIPLMRVNSHLVPEDGIHTCKAAGYYSLRFDNSYSWFNSKKIHYSFKLSESSDDVDYNEAQEITENTDL